MREDLQAFAVKIECHGHAHGPDANQTCLHFFVVASCEVGSGAAVSSEYTCRRGERPGEEESTNGVGGSLGGTAIAGTAESNEGLDQCGLRFIASAPDSHDRDVRASDHVHDRDYRGRLAPSES